MPIEIQTITKYVIAPMALLLDGSAELTLVGTVVWPGGESKVVSRQEITLSPGEVAAILGAPTRPDMSRLDDLTTAIYEYLVTQGYAPAGAIS